MDSTASSEYVSPNSVRYASSRSTPSADALATDSPVEPEFPNVCHVAQLIVRRVLDDTHERRPHVERVGVTGEADRLRRQCP